jgi:hypothetical protein
MGNIFNDDFRDFIKSFNDNNVDYILIGGMAVILHGYVRTTGDMDLWVRKSEDNYKKIIKAFYDFRMPVFDMTLEAFLGDKSDVWGFGRQPVKIEILTEVKGLKFDKAFSQSQIFIEENLNIRLLYLKDLIQSKKAAGRFKDLDDIEQLTKK